MPVKREVFILPTVASSSSSTASEINLEQCDSRAEVLKEDMELASIFIKTLFAVLYEVYSSSVSVQLALHVPADDFCVY